jgi:hypothetical protein
MVPIDNGYRLQLDIPNVFSGMAGVSGNQLAFIPTGRGRPELVRSGTLDGFQIPLAVQKGKAPFYGATFDPFLLARLRADAVAGASA